MLDWQNKPGKAYLEMARDHVRLAGIRDGLIPTISRTGHPQHWREWYQYYRFRRMYASMEIMRRKDEHTVPCVSPMDFDAAFSPSGNLPEVPRE